MNCASSVEPLRAVVDEVPPQMSDRVEITGADEGLMLHCAIVAAGLVLEFTRLKFRICAHPRLAISLRKLKHREVQRVKSGEGDELKLRNRSVVEFLLPVERRRTVVRQQLARILLVDRVSESTRVLHVWFRRFAPDDVCVRRISECARNRLVQPRFDGEETFGSPASGKERMVALVNVAREQAGTVCV